MSEAIDTMSDEAIDNMTKPQYIGYRMKASLSHYSRLMQIATEFRVRMFNDVVTKEFEAFNSFLNQYLAETSYRHFDEMTEILPWAAITACAPIDPYDKYHEVQFHMTTAAVVTMCYNCEIAENVTRNTMTLFMQVIEHMNMFFFNMFIEAANILAYIYEDFAIAGKDYDRIWGA